MELEVIKSEKNLLEFIIKGERHTYPNLLRSILLEDSNVEFVSYLLEHPMDNEAKFVLRVKKGTPKKTLDEATKKIESELKNFDSVAKKAFK